MLAPDFQRLEVLLPALIAEAAQGSLDRALRAHESATALFARVACGAQDCVPLATRALHLTAFEAASFAEMALFAGRIDADQAQELHSSVRAAQARALDIERLHQALALAPSEAFFDDVLPRQALSRHAAQAQGQRAEKPAPGWAVGVGAA